MWTGCHNMIYAISIEHFNIHQCLHLKKEFIPDRFAGSPVQPSSVPSTAKLTPLCKILAIALVIFLALSSKLPAQPTQNKIQGASEAFI